MPLIIPSLSFRYRPLKARGYSRARYTVQTRAALLPLHSGNCPHAAPFSTRRRARSSGSWVAMPIGQVRYDIRGTAGSQARSTPQMQSPLRHSHCDRFRKIAARAKSSCDHKIDIEVMIRRNFFARYNAYTVGTLVESFQKFLGDEPVAPPRPSMVIKSGCAWAMYCMSFSICPRRYFLRQSACLTAFAQLATSFSKSCGQLTQSNLHGLITSFPSGLLRIRAISPIYLLTRQ